jgi:hypothetical protein
MTHTVLISRRGSLNAAMASIASVLGFAALAAMFGFGIWMQAQVHLNHDVAWILHSAGWMLEGRRFGSEIVDVNPPLIWFLSLPPAALVKAGLLAEPEALRLYMWSVCLASLAVCHVVLAPMRAAGRRAEAMAIVLSSALGIALLAGPSFGQREYLSFALGLPYCLLLLVRTDFQTAPDARLRVVVGVMAGIAFGFKPWLLAVPVLLEIVHLASTRSVRSLWRAETLALGATLLVYGLAIVVFTPDYLIVTLPLARATYWAYEATSWARLWQTWSASLQIVVISGVLLAISRSLPKSARVLLCAYAGFSFSFWLQRKGFTYHLYPALATAYVLLAFSTVHACRAILSGKYSARPFVRVVATCALAAFAANQLQTAYWTTLSWHHAYDMHAPLSTGDFRKRLIEKIDELAPPGSYVYAFSTHPFPAFPTLSYTRAQAASALVVHLAAPAVQRLDEISDPVLRKRVLDAIAVQRDYVVEEFKRYRPAVVLVNTAYPALGLTRGRFDYVRFYAEDPRFAALWRDYREIERIEALRVFVREVP